MRDFVKTNKLIHQCAWIACCSSTFSYIDLYDGESRSRVRTRAHEHERSFFVNSHQNLQERPRARLSTRLGSECVGEWVTFLDSWKWANVQNLMTLPIAATARGWGDGLQDHREHIATVHALRGFFGIWHVVKSSGDRYSAFIAQTFAFMRDCQTRTNFNLRLNLRLNQTLFGKQSMMHIGKWSKEISFSLVLEPTEAPDRS